MFGLLRVKTESENAAENEMCLYERNTTTFFTSNILIRFFFLDGSLDAKKPINVTDYRKKKPAENEKIHFQLDDNGFSCTILFAYSQKCLPPFWGERQTEKMLKKIWKTPTM